MRLSIVCSFSNVFCFNIFRFSTRLVCQKCVPEEKANCLVGTEQAPGVRKSTDYDENLCVAESMFSFPLSLLTIPFPSNAFMDVLKHCAYQMILFFPNRSDRDR